MIRRRLEAAPECSPRLAAGAVAAEAAAFDDEGGEVGAALKSAAAEAAAAGMTGAPSATSMGGAVAVSAEVAGGSTGTSGTRRRRGPELPREPVAISDTGTAG